MVQLHEYLEEKIKKPIKRCFKGLVSISGDIGDRFIPDNVMIYNMEVYKEVKETIEVIAKDITNIIPIIEKITEKKKKKSKLHKLLEEINANINYIKGNLEGTLAGAKHAKPFGPAEVYKASVDTCIKKFMYITPKIEKVIKITKKVKIEL